MSWPGRSLTLGSDKSCGCINASRSGAAHSTEGQPTSAAVAAGLEQSVGECCQERGKKVEELHQIPKMVILVSVRQDMINWRSTLSSAQMSDICPSHTAGLFFPLKHTAMKGKLKNGIGELMVEKVQSWGLQKTSP